MTTETTSEAPTYCAVHPDRETGLRCISCDRYMCVECAVRTPVGYRCRECVRGQQAVFYKATRADDVITFAVCFGLTAGIIAIFSAINFGGLWLALILGLPAGAGISELALRATKRRRSFNSHIISTVGAVTGGIAGALVPVLLRYLQMMDIYQRLISRLSPEEIAQLEAQMARTGANAMFGASFPEYALHALTRELGLLLLIGLIAAAVYGRYRMRM